MQSQGGVSLYKPSPLHPVLLDRVQEIFKERLKFSDSLEECEQGGHDLAFRA